MPCRPGRKHGVGKWRARCDNRVHCGSVEGTVTKDPSKDGPEKILRNLGCGRPRFSPGLEQVTLGNRARVGV